MTSQFAYHNFFTAEGIIRLLLLLLLRLLLIRLLLLIQKIAVGKREAVAFKYRLKSILSHRCQLSPLSSIYKKQAWYAECTYHIAQVKQNKESAISKNLEQDKIVEGTVRQATAANKHLLAGR